MTVFHWHGETFDLPDHAVWLYSSEATPNQGFIFGNNVLALQFHPEMTLEGVENLVENCGSELTGGPCIMSGKDLTGSHLRYHAAGYRMIETLFRYYFPG